jgi:glycosyltransferase involved in cell wall biosynthesis
MKIVFISGREPSYVRNAMIIKSLAGQGAEIIDCADSSANYPTRFIRVLVNYFARYKMRFDVVFVGFFGQPLVPIIRKLTAKPIVFDAFLSAYDTICFDRKRFKPDSLVGLFLYWLDRNSCELADLVLLDTEAHIDYFTKTFDLPRNKFRRLFVGADETIFYPREIQRDGLKFSVFYHSSFLPLHGTEYIVRAADCLREYKEIEFILVGHGREHKKIRTLVESLMLENIRFIDWLPFEALPVEISKADVCLGGHFSDIDKAKRVIAGKTFQFLAMQKPVIVGDCLGNRELLTDRKDALLVTMADAGALARAILELRADACLREQIAFEGYRTFLEKCTVQAIGRELMGVLSGHDYGR